MTLVKKIALVALFGCVAIGFAYNRAASDETPFIKAEPQGNQIQLNGYFGGGDEKKGIFTLYVDAFAFPGDKTRRLPNIRAKRIRIPASPRRMRDMETSKEISLSHIEPGRRVAVIGIDTGWRKELNASEMLIFGPKISGMPSWSYGEIDEKDQAIAKQEEEIAQLRAEIEQLKADLKKINEK